MKSKSSKLILGTVILVGIVFTAVFAFAASGMRGGHGCSGMPGHGMGHGADGFGHVYGEITAIDGNEITVTPGVPEFFKDKMGKHGVHSNIELPATAVVTVTGDTTFYVDGAEASFEDFGVGDTIMAVGADDGSFNITARRIADPASMKAHMDDMQGKFAGKYAECGFGHDGGHPMFGQIMAMDAEGVTIKPEIPEFMQEMIESHHKGTAIDLPEEVTLTWGEELHFMVAGELVDENPFKVGDKVGMLVKGMFDDGDAVVLGMGDYATAEQYMGEMKGKAHGMHGGMGHPHCRGDYDGEGHHGGKPGHGGPR